jgi:hypothetical protein
MMIFCPAPARLEHSTDVLLLRFLPVIKMYAGVIICIGFESILRYDCHAPARPQLFFREQAETKSALV